MYERRMTGNCIQICTNQAHTQIQPTFCDSKQKLFNSDLLMSQFFFLSSFQSIQRPDHIL